MPNAAYVIYIRRRHISSTNWSKSDSWAILQVWPLRSCCRLLQPKICPGNDAPPARANPASQSRFRLAESRRCLAPGRLPEGSPSEPPPPSFYLFFFNDTATTEIYTLSLHDALPI